MSNTVDALPRINPKEITNLRRTQHEKEKFLIFCVLCAGKSSDVMAEKLENLLEQTTIAGWEYGPFDYLDYLHDVNRLESELKKHKIGKYDLLMQFFRYVFANSYVQEKCGPFTNWHRSDLVDAPGISYKTASLYRMHCFGDKIACLDTHVLRWLRNEGFKGVPKASPSNWETYRHWENVFLGECYKREVEPNHFDLSLWKEATAA